MNVERRASAAGSGRQRILANAIRKVRGLRSTTMLVASLAASAAAVAPAAARAEAPVTIRYSELGVSAANLYQYLAVQKGIYAANGVDLRIVQFLRGGPESIAAAASGQVDMGSVGTPVLTGISRGVHLKVVGAPAYKTQPFVLVGAPNIHDVAELKDKDVAFGSVGGGAEEAAKYIFAAHKMDVDSVHNVGGGATSTGYLALKAGRVSAVVLTDLYVTLAEHTGTGHVLARASDYFGHYEHSYIFASDAFIASHPDAIRRFFVANRAAVRYAKAHPDELLALARQLLHMDDAVLKTTIAQYLPQWDDSGQIDQQGMLNAVKAVQEVGDISPAYRPTVAQIADLRFVNAAQKEEAGAAPANRADNASDNAAAHRALASAR